MPCGGQAMHIIPIPLKSYYQPSSEPSIVSSIEYGGGRLRLRPAGGSDGPAGIDERSGASVRILVAGQLELHGLGSLPGATRDQDGAIASYDGGCGYGGGLELDSLDSVGANCEVQSLGGAGVESIWSCVTVCANASKYVEGGVP